MLSLPTEKEMYPAIEKFLKAKGCDRTLIEGVSFDSVKRWIIDVAGIKGARIYAVEAKPKLNFDSFLTALTQVRFYKQACTHVYVCLPEPTSDKESELFPYIEKICEQEKIGLLLFTSEQKIREIREPEESKPDLDKYFQVMQQLTSERPSDKIQGARAYIIRDLCYYLWTAFRGKANKSNLCKYFFSRKPESDRYWKWKQAYINPRTTAKNTLDATIKAAEELGLIECNDAILYLTTLGRELVKIIDNSKIGTPELDKNVKAFFYALSLRYPEIRETIHILKEFKKEMLYGINECPNCSKKFWADKAIIEEGKIRCPNCKQELSLQSEKTSLLCRLILKLYYNPYPQLVFWINSKVLPIKTMSRNKYIIFSSD